MLNISPRNIDKKEIIEILKCKGTEFQSLLNRAVEIRNREIGNRIYLRGIVEFSNYCKSSCLYCGLNVTNDKIKRYRLSEKEILDAALKVEKYGIKTIVLQSGEDNFFTVDKLCSIIRIIKSETSLKITLSTGEFPEEELVKLKDAGADRYLLKFETSDIGLYNSLHFNTKQKYNRIYLLKKMHAIGFEVGSGIIVGLPGQTFESIADDIELFISLDLDMIGIGPYIPDPDTPIGKNYKAPPEDSKYVPNSKEMSYKVIALTRILCPDVNIPSTTALKTIDPSGYKGGFQAGANIVMPCFTPSSYLNNYAIYPRVRESDIKKVLNQIEKEANECDLTIDMSEGTSKHYLKRRDL
ncbi:MAG: [FeFe] hydrogenase H-cluster radical SAM maturase HydE [Chitinispirillaceae bacterium]|nr:[FeFe] hydrogenase H-cluster radical SAM maturase HydE [Chitinispirillaceae bacterium]